MNELKIKLLEKIILVTIIISIIVILFFVIDALKIKPKDSESNLIENYSLTKIHKYNENINLSLKYNIPISELIIQEGSSYTIYLTSTDNYINTITEKIIIRYSALTPDEQTAIKNYCNSYDTIELQYKLQCTYNKETMILKNQFNLNKLNKNIITHNNLTITLPIEKNTKLSDYLESLKELNIHPIQVNEIE